MHSVAHRSSKTTLNSCAVSPSAGLPPAPRSSLCIRVSCWAAVSPWNQGRDICVGPTTVSWTWGTVPGVMNHSGLGDYFSFSLVWQHSSDKKGMIFQSRPGLPCARCNFCYRGKMMWPRPPGKTVTVVTDVNPRLPKVCPECPLPAGEGEDKPARLFLHRRALPSPAGRPPRKPGLPGFTQPGPGLPKGQTWNFADFESKRRGVFCQRMLAVRLGGVRDSAELVTAAATRAHRQRDESLPGEG